MNTYRSFIAADFPNQVIEKIRIIQESLIRRQSVGRPLDKP